MDGARRAIATALRQGETLPAFALHGNAKARQQLQRDVDVRLGNQLADHLDGDGALSRHQRQSQQ